MFSKNTRAALFDSVFEFMLDFSSADLVSLDNCQIKLEFDRLREQAFDLVKLMERVTPEHVARHTPTLVAVATGGVLLDGQN